MTDEGPRPSGEHEVPRATVGEAAPVPDGGPPRERRTMLGDLARCLELLTPSERWRWAALLPIAVATAAVEAMTAVALLTLIRIVGDPLAVRDLPGIAWLRPALPGEASSAVPVLLLAMALYALRSGVLAAAIALRQAVVSESATRLAERVVRAYLDAPYAFHLRRDSARLIRTATEAVDVSVRTFLASAVALATEVCVAAGLVAVVSAVSPGAALLAAAAALALAFAPLRLTRSIFARWGREQQTAHEGMLRSLQQALGAVKQVKVTGREAFFHAAFARHRRGLDRLHRREAVLSEGVRLAVETAFLLALLLVALVVTLQRGAGAEALPVLGLYAYAGFRVIPAVNRIMLHGGLLHAGRAAVADLHADLTALAAAGAAPLPPGGAGEDIAFREAIRFERVAYAYADDRGTVLRDVDLVIRPRESVGIVGPSGAGKSTLVDLLLGLLEPTAGRVTVDGRDIGRGLRAWQRRVGYVPQDALLLQDTLRGNIAFGVPREAVDPRRLDAAVRRAGLLRVVASLPRGLDTPIGERGVRLSGGERQRVAIARALYEAPEILVFDEAMSALDPLTEAEVARAIGDLRGETTLVVIAHRLATVRRCDRIVVLNEGRVTAVGAFDDLMARDAGFRALAGSEP